MSEQRLSNLRTWYQIPNKFNPRLPVRGEWCCNPRFGIGVYKAYFLGGFRLPLNTFARELLVRLGICQFNPNAWRLIISMQILWREVFGGDCPLTVDEFLFCYKPSEINQSLGFYQFMVRGKDCRLIKSLASSDRNWKTEFICLWFLGREPCGRWQGPIRPLLWELREPSSWRYVPPLFLLSLHFFVYIYVCVCVCVCVCVLILAYHLFYRC